MACSKCWWFDGQEKCSGDCRRRKRNVYEAALNWVISLVIMGVLLSCVSCNHKMTEEEVYRRWPNLKPPTSQEIDHVFNMENSPAYRAAYLRKVGLSDCFSDLKPLHHE